MRNHASIASCTTSMLMRSICLRSYACRTPCITSIKPHFVSIVIARLMRYTVNVPSISAPISARVSGPRHVS